MEVRQVRLATRSTDETARFWARLGCAVDTAADDGVRVTVGTSQLVFHALDGMTGAHHLAFTIPTGSFAAAKDWVAARATVLGTPDTDEFEGPPSWNSRSVYFEGPDHQLLELIERRDPAPSVEAVPSDPGGLGSTLELAEGVLLR